MLIEAVTLRDQRRLAWGLRMPLEQGLKRTVAFYKEHKKHYWQ